MIRAVLFDLDETLLDRTASIRQFLDAQYRAFADHLDHIPYETYRDRFLVLDEFGYAPKERVYDRLVNEFALDVPATTLLDDFRENGWRACILFPGARELLQHLRTRGYRLAIVTNGAVSSQQAKVDHAGLADLVDQVLISEAEGVRKPDPIIFQRAVDRLGVQPAECVFVGDNPAADIGGARNVGMKTIWRRGHLPWPEDQPPSADRTITDLALLFELDFDTL